MPPSKVKNPKSTIFDEATFDISNTETKNTLIIFKYYTAVELEAYVRIINYELST